MANGTLANQSVEKALHIIEALAQAEAPMRLIDIAAAVGIPSSTTLRMLTSLISAGYTYQDPDTLRYGLTMRFTQIGYRVLEQFSIRDIVHPYLVGLVRQFGETACLAIDQGMQAIYLDVVENTDNLINIRQRVGRQAPLHATGSGKLFLAHYPPEKRQAFLAEHELTAFTPFTITDPEKLEKALRQVCLQGYATDDQEIENGVRCVSVPIFNYKKSLIATVSISGPLSRMDDERLKIIIEQMKKTAEEISARLLYMS